LGLGDVLKGVAIKVLSDWAPNQRAQVSWLHHHYVARVDPISLNALVRKGLHCNQYGGLYGLVNTMAQGVANSLPICGPDASFIWAGAPWCYREHTNFFDRWVIWGVKFPLWG